MDQDLAMKRGDELNPERSKSGADKPGLWRYFMALAATLACLYVLNFQFHHDFFDRKLQGKMPPVPELQPLWLTVIYTMSTLAMMAIVARRPATASLWPGRRPRRRLRRPPHLRHLEPPEVRLATRVASLRGASGHHIARRLRTDQRRGARELAAFVRR